MVNTKSMAAHQDQVNGVDGLEASVSNEARPETPRMNVLERKIQGLTANMRLLMEQNREIILELRGRRSASGDGNTGQPRSHTP